MTKTRIVFAMAVLALIGAKRRAVEVTQPPVAELRTERSFAITEKSVLAPFTLDRVLAALIAHSVAPSTTPEQFFRRMFDTQNPKPGLDASLPHCDDALLNGKPASNGYLRRCPTAEGILASEPFRPEQFVPVAIVNRFDLADPSGATCGQYRITFERDSGDPLNLLNIIFEGALRNPLPSAGIEGCRPIAQFWANLSAIDSLAERRTRLEAFFFDGVAGFPPLLHPDHFRDAPAGIRDMQWTGLTTTAPRFYQFRIVNQCDGGTCRVYAKPDLLENLASGHLLDGSDTSDRATRFRDVIVDNVKNLALPDANRFSMKIPSEFLMVENDPGDGVAHFLLLAGFQRGARTPAGMEFRTRVESELRTSGSTMTVEELLTRGSITNCEGCHVSLTGPIGDEIWFPAAGPDLQHVARTLVESGEEGTGSRYTLSFAMKSVFIPNRMRILKEFLASGKAPAPSK
jgi:hypothetical protein